MAKMYQKHGQGGFTIVEVIVTLIVTTLFVTAFFQTILAMQSQRIAVSRQAKASDIAFSNLRKITQRPESVTCDSSMDLLADGDAAGKDLSDYFTPEPSSVTQGLGGTVTQTMKAYAPAGCDDYATHPIKIVSTITYGTNGDTVTHATLIR